MMGISYNKGQPRLMVGRGSGRFGELHNGKLCILLGAGGDGSPPPNAILHEVPKIDLIPVLIADSRRSRSGLFMYI